ncbi:MAG: YdcF family protein [bacterium]
MVCTGGAHASLRAHYVAILDRSVVCGDGFRMLRADHVRRIDTGIATLREILVAPGEGRRIVCHGMGPRCPAGEFVSQARLARNYLVAKAPDLAPYILLEERSRDTIGNILFLRALIEESTGELAASLQIVSSGYHAPRVAWLARRVFGATPYAIRIVCSPDMCDLEWEQQCAAEMESLAAARRLFDGLSDGDFTGMSRRLFEKHKLYQSSDPRIGLLALQGHKRKHTQE